MDPPPIAPKPAKPAKLGRTRSLSNIMRRRSSSMAAAPDFLRALPTSGTELVLASDTSAKKDRRSATLLVERRRNSGETQPNPPPKSKLPSSEELDLLPVDWKQPPPRARSASQTKIDPKPDLFVEPATSEPDTRLKWIVVGNAGVGKTSLLARFCDDIFSPAVSATMGIDFKVKTVEFDGKKIKLHIWDTAGQERFRAITKAYYQGAHAVIFVYDVTNSPSFINLVTWMEDCSAHLNKNQPPVMVLIGNKVDCAPEERQVDSESAARWCAHNGMRKYTEVSCKTGLYVHDAMMDLVKRVLPNQAGWEAPSQPPLRLDLAPKQDKKSGCC